MKTLHFVNAFSPLSQTFIYDYVTELERMEVDNHVVTGRRMNEDSRSFPNVTVVEKPGALHPQRLWYRALETVGLRQRHTSGWPKHRERLAEVVQRLEPDVIHAHFGEAGVRIGPVASAHDVPLITTFYGIDAFKFSQIDPWRREYPHLFRRATRLIALSQMMADHLVSLGAPYEMVEVVHLGKKMKSYPYRAPDGSPKKWISVGRLVEKKGHAECIRAFARLVEKKPESRLEIIGKGERYRKLRELIDQLELGEHVRLLGSRPHDEVRKRMGRADAFILCSKRAQDGDQEGTPTVLMEAQAMGLPIVTTQHSGIPEVIPESNHDVLAPEGDVEAIANRLQWLSTRSVRELKAMSRRGRRKVEREFNLRDEAARLQDLYRSVC